VSLEKPHNSSALARAVVIVWSRARVLGDRDNRVCVTTATVYRMERGPQCFSRKLDSGDSGERPRGARSGASLAREKGPRLCTELLDHGAWPLRGLPFALGHQRGLVRNLRVLNNSLNIPVSSTQESIHLYSYSCHI
jgi:hypothetical protein